MTPLDRLRLEKAAADCGFEISVRQLDGDGVELRSAKFPEALAVHVAPAERFTVRASDPVILHGGGDEQSLEVVGYGALYELLRAVAACARARPNRVSDEYKRRVSGFPTTTEAERLVLQRIGQSLFRDALLDYWQGRCCLTGLDFPALLRASHIRPWVSCDTDEQRLDVFNGLLLAPHADALFDSGLMTFADSGDVLWSTAVKAEHLVALGLPATAAIRSLHPNHLTYLEYHRRHVWRG
jgi:hypothetical protein